MNFNKMFESFSGKNKKNESAEGYDFVEKLEAALNKLETHGANYFEEFFQTADRTLVDLEVYAGKIGMIYEFQNLKAKHSVALDQMRRFHSRIQAKNMIHPDEMKEFIDEYKKFSDGLGIFFASADLVPRAS